MIPRYLFSFNTDTLPSLDCDVLVVGSGVAGLSTALRLSGFADVILVTKSELQASSTMHAQGGIAAVIDKHDSCESHIEDTLVAGAGLCDPEATEVLVREGPDRVLELLEEYHARFDTSGGTLDLAKEGGHTHARVVHARGDATGSEVESALGRALLGEPAVNVMEHHFLVDILLDGGSCVGAIVEDTRRKTLTVVWPKAVVLASGGTGEIYLVTTNPTICTGDGVAVAFRAGARVSDLEFVQFHPTALHIPEEPKFLISEAIRGEGALLVDVEGNRVMEGQHPLTELAPRDVVVARMVEVMKEQQTNHLYLDVRHLDPERMRARFPNIHQHCLEAGIDITRNRIPVSPAAHYMSGGVITDLQGRTDIPGLYACGEVACTGVHGANRLASNSLLEGLVFARRIALSIDEYPGGTRQGARPTISWSGKAEGPRVSEDLLRGNLREVMRDSVGMLRFEKELSGVLEFLSDNAGVLQTEYLDVRGMELKNMFTLAHLITTSALMRLESRGCHRRRDYADLDDWNWRKHIDLRMVEGDVAAETRPQHSRVRPHAGALTDDKDR
ncbi:MAG: L-aspartate oxidase [Actinobacteria bacterium]|nr:L-aspartate oxidase [Actinomycetota bacterium]MCG2820147.1 L-aspartate oxidase [Actinomycetes bacterium]MBU4219204.1 L-aspartate oxidase [Actinomycetota bacterium]MBU4359047.1 L-aspartate oxidase [Actinomycetota bacterium]MBU4392942.1 L-aspartate oxidase [Actinomycetota bacterium]